MTNHTRKYKILAEYLDTLVTMTDGDDILHNIGIAFLRMSRGFYNHYFYNDQIAKLKQSQQKGLIRIIKKI